MSVFHVYSFHKHCTYAVCSCYPESFSSPGVGGICALREYSIDSAVEERSDARPLHKSFIKLEELPGRKDEAGAKTVSTQSISVNKSNRSQCLSPLLRSTPDKTRLKGAEHFLGGRLPFIFID